MAPRFRDLKRFCENNGWELIRDTDHFYYEKVLANGMVLKTKVSHALQKEIPGNLWDRIRKQQLKVTEKEFWDSI